MGQESSMALSRRKQPEVLRTVRVEIEDLLHAHNRARQNTRAAKDADHGLLSNVAARPDFRHRLTADSRRRFQLDRSEAVGIQPLLKARPRGEFRLPFRSPACLCCLDVHSKGSPASRVSYLHMLPICVSKAIYFGPVMMTRKKALPPLLALGLLVRETRIRKGLTQQRASKEAGVSRKQWVLLEQGENASAAFIQKVAAYLELRTIPLGDGLEATMGARGL